MWTLDDAIQFVRNVSKVTSAAGWYPSIGGGVLMNGFSIHDLDIVFIPRYKANLNDLHSALIDAGCRNKRDSETMRAGWEFPDPKHVEEWETADGKRIDVIILIFPDCAHKNTTMGFGLAGDGYGPYEYCVDCGTILHKTQESTS